MSTATYDEGYVHSIEFSRKPVKAEDGEEMRDLAILRVRFNRPVKVGDEYEDRGGFWANVEVWGNRAKSLEVIKKGAIVGVFGQLVVNEWEDKESGEPRSAIVVKARSVSILPRCIESVQFKVHDGENGSNSNGDD